MCIGFEYLSTTRTRACEFVSKSVYWELIVGIPRKQKLFGIGKSWAGYFLRPKYIYMCIYIHTSWSTLPSPVQRDFLWQIFFPISCLSSIPDSVTQTLLLETLELWSRLLRLGVTIPNANYTGRLTGLACSLGVITPPNPPWDPYWDRPVDLISFFLSCSFFFLTGWEFLLKTDSRYPKDAGATIYSPWRILGISFWEFRFLFMYKTRKNVYYVTTNKHDSYQ